MRRLLILTLPALLTLACDSGNDDGGDDRNASIKALSGDATAGETVFSSGCGVDACHGSDGNSGTAPALNTVASGLSDDQIIDSVLDGKGGMPPQALEDQQMADALAWIRSNF